MEPEAKRGAEEGSHPSSKHQSLGLRMAEVEEEDLSGDK